MSVEESDLAKLFNVADDDEANMLQELAVKAGLLWKCPNCRFYNDSDSPKCRDCGKKKP